MKDAYVIVLHVLNSRNGTQMRWLVFFLIVLNGLVFAWFSYQQQYNSTANEAVQVEQFDFSSVHSLALLSEIDAKELERRDLRLVAKSTAAKELVETEVESKQDNAPAVAATESQCVVMGSFPEIISARQGRIELEAQGIETKVVQIAKQLPAVSWVYIPPQPSRKDALIILKSLQDKKIDSFLMSEPGEYQYAISLGFFGNEDSALSIQKERKAQGYDAHITKRVRERKAYWIGVEDPSLLTDNAHGKIIEDWLDSKRNIKKQEIVCAELALMPTIN